VLSIVIIREFLFYLVYFGVSLGTRLTYDENSEMFIAQYFPRMMARATAYAQSIPVQRQIVGPKASALPNGT
jgi:hypothetical protein